MSDTSPTKTEQYLDIFLKAAKIRPYTKAEQKEKFELNVKKNVAKTRRAMKDNPDDPKGYADLGFWRMQDPAFLGSAETFLHKAIDLISEGNTPIARKREKDLPSIMNNLGLCLFHQGKFDSSKTTLKQALTLKAPDSAQNLAACLIELGEHDEAVLILATLISIERIKGKEKLNARAHHDYARCLEHIGMNEYAAEHYILAKTHLEKDNEYNPYTENIASNVKEDILRCKRKNPSYIPSAEHD